MTNKWEVIKEKMKKKKFWGQMLAGFFVLMIVCTFVSRAADSLTVPKAQVKAPAPGHLEYKIEGSGSVKASEGTLVTLPEKLRVSQVLEAGTLVEAGTPVCVCDMEELQKVLEEEQAELQKLVLQLAQEQKTGAPDQITPQTYSAGKALDLARSQYDDALAEAENLRQRKEQESEARRQEAETKKQELAEELAAMGEEADPELKASYDERMNALDEANDLKDQSDQAEIQAQDDKAESMRQALLQAENAYDIAQKEDENSSANRQKAKDASNLVQQGLQVDIEQQQKKVDRLNAVAAAQGQIQSPVKGSISETNLKEGMVTSGQEYMRIGTGGYRFQASADSKDLELLKTGDEIIIQFQGKTNKTKAKITQLIAAGEDEDGNQINQQGNQTDGQNSAGSGSMNSTGKIIAELQEGDYAEGMQGEYSIDKKSDIRYNWVLPVSAVREDQGGAYCLVAKKKSTILGEEYVAERVNLTKKAKDVNQIAVEGVLTDDTKVIIESTKEIEEGDRLQIEYKK